MHNSIPMTKEEITQSIKDYGVYFFNGKPFLLGHHIKEFSEEISKATDSFDDDFIDNLLVETCGDSLYSPPFFPMIGIFFDTDHRNEYDHFLAKLGISHEIIKEHELEINKPMLFVELEESLENVLEKICLIVESEFK